MRELHLEGPDVLIIAILVLWLGSVLTKRIPLLGKYSIPMAVTGGLICSILVVIIASTGGPKISFDMEIRDILLLVFFSTIGLSAKLSFGKIFIVLCIQILVISVFAVFIIFRVMGKTYDAAVIAGGFCGLGMGATPVAIANMNAVTLKYGPSFKAFLVIPLVGAFFIDILNALIIKFFLGLPIMQKTTAFVFL